MTPNTPSDNNIDNINELDDETTSSMKTMCENIAQDVDDYINSLNFTEEQKDITHKAVCQFVFEYLLSEFDDRITINTVKQLMVDLNITDTSCFRTCCDIVYHVIRNIPRE